MLIGIDGSTVATGFSFGGVENGVPKGGVWELPGAADHVFDLTLMKVMESLMSLARLIKATRVCIEAPILVNDSEHSADTTMKLIQLTGALRVGAKRAGCQVTLVSVRTVRKHFIGVGNLRRKEAKAAVMRRCDLLRWSYIDDNQADSAAVWSYGMSTFYPQWSPRSTPLFGRAANV
jgi:Holliday junction resolvasome RuvABC endonuclease subunit